MQFGSPFWLTLPTRPCSWLVSLMKSADFVRVWAMMLLNALWNICVFRPSHLWWTHSAQWMGHIGLRSYGFAFRLCPKQLRNLGKLLNLFVPQFPHRNLSFLYIIEGRTKWFTFSKWMESDGKDKKRSEEISLSWDGPWLLLAVNSKH